MDMYCTHCGKELKEDEKFCGRCGTKTNNIEISQSNVLKEISTQNHKVINDNKDIHGKSTGKKLKIPFGLWLIIVMIVGTFILAIIMILNKRSIQTPNNIKNQIQTEITKNKILDIIDEPNGEFKINGMELISALTKAREQIDKEDNTPYIEALGLQYKKTSEVSGVSEYAVGTPSQLQGNGVYPALLVGINESTNNVVYIGVSYPYEGSTGRNYLTTAIIHNYRLLKIALQSLNYTELWNTIDTMINSNNQYFESGLNGIYYGVVDGYDRPNGTISGEYCLFWALNIWSKNTFEVKTMEENTSTLSQENTTTSKENTITTSKQNVDIKLDIDKFIKELSYKSMSTVHDGIHGGDGYRQDYEFYNSDLSINNFKVTTQNNEKKYVLETNGNTEHKYKFVLTIILGQDNKLHEINITCNPPTLQAEGILNCALEVEEALGYTVFNKRNYQNEEQLEKTLKSKGYIETQGKYNILVDNIIEKIENTETGEKSVFILDNGKLTYTISFDDV